MEEHLARHENTGEQPEQLPNTRFDLRVLTERQLLDQLTVQFFFQCFLNESSKSIDPEHPRHAHTHILFECVIEDAVQVTLLDLLSVLRRHLRVGHDGAEHLHGLMRQFGLPLESVQQWTLDIRRFVLPSLIFLRAEVLLGVRLQRVQVVVRLRIALLS